MNRPTFPA